jgi:hypothetical protein
MQVTRTSTLTGITRTIEINCTQEQLNSWERGNDLIQNIMPQLSMHDREFIMTGITIEEWESAFDDSPGDYEPEPF